MPAEPTPTASAPAICSGQRKPAKPAGKQRGIPHFMCIWGPAKKLQCEQELWGKVSHHVNVAQRTTPARSRGPRCSGPSRRGTLRRDPPKSQPRRGERARGTAASRHGANAAVQGTRAEPNPARRPRSCPTPQRSHNPSITHSHARVRIHLKTCLNRKARLLHWDMLLQLTCHF